MKTALLFLMISPLFAQVSAVLSSTVMDQSGAVVPDVAVTAKNHDTGAVRVVDTDNEGHYQFFSLPPGEYEISGAKSGFAPAVRTGIQLVVGQLAVDLNLKLGVAQGQL